MMDRTYIEEAIRRGKPISAQRAAALLSALDATEIENAVLRDNDRSVEAFERRLRRAEADAAALRDVLTQIRALAPSHSHIVARVDAAKAVYRSGAELLTDLEAAYHALLSYAHGNTAPALAAEVAEKIGRSIGKVGK